MTKAEAAQIERRRTWFNSLGAYLGFPSCCTAAFPAAVSRVDGPWIGTGYMACPKCAEHIGQIGFPRFIAEVIAPARKAPVPFPEWDGTEEEVARLWAEFGLL